MTRRLSLRRGRIALAGLVAGAGLAGTLACKPFGNRGDAVCGNGIVEPDAGEDCDGSEGCLPPSSDTPCALTCADAACPSGFACGLDAVCRRPGFDFTRAERALEAGTVWGVALDLDGDGRDELISIEAESDATSGTLAVTVFDETRAVADRWTWPGVTALPDFADVDGDGLQDILLLAESGTAPLDGDIAEHRAGVLVLLNDGEGSYVPQVAASAWRQRSDAPPNLPPEATLLSVVARPKPGRIRDQVGYTTYETMYDIGTTDDAIYSSEFATEVAQFLRPADTSTAECFDEPFVIGMPALGGGEENTIKLWRTCDDELTELGAAVFPGEDFFGPGPSGTILRYEDLNDDGTLDIIADARVPFMPGTWIAVAYGVPDGTFHSSSPVPTDTPGDGQFTPEFSGPYRAEFGTRILDYADIDADGVADALLDEALALSANGCIANTCPCGHGHTCTAIGQWSAGRFFDLNADGWTDVVGIVQTREGAPNAFTMLYNGPTGFVRREIDTGDLEPRDLEIADLDGDGQLDAAVRLSDPLEDPFSPVPSTLMVLWGGTEDEATSSLDLPTLQPGLAAERSIGTVRPEDRLVTLLGPDSDGETGVARVIVDAQRRLLAPVPTRASQLTHLTTGRFGGGAPKSPWPAPSPPSNAWACHKTTSAPGVGWINHPTPR